MHYRIVDQKTGRTVETFATLDDAEKVRARMNEAAKEFRYTIPMPRHSGSMECNPRGL